MTWSSSSLPTIASGIRSVFKFDNTIRSHLVRRKNAGCVKNLIYTKFTQCKFGAKKCKLRLNQALEFTTPCTLACKCGIYHLCPWFPPNLHFFARIQLFVQVEQFVRFFGNKVKYTLAKRKEVCMNGLQSKMAFANYLEFLEVYRGVAKIFSEVRTIFQMPLLFLQVAVTISTPQRCVEIC